MSSWQNQKRREKRERQAEEARLEEERRAELEARPFWAGEEYSTDVGSWLSTPPGSKDPA